MTRPRGNSTFNILALVPRCGGWCGGAWGRMKCETPKTCLSHLCHLYPGLRPLSPLGRQESQGTQSSHPRETEHVAKANFLSFPFRHVEGSFPCALLSCARPRSGKSCRPRAPRVGTRFRSAQGAHCACACPARRTAASPDPVGDLGLRGLTPQPVPRPRGRRAREAQASLGTPCRRGLLQAAAPASCAPWVWPG